jgi:Ca2+-binding EF-hand superfamily protein
MRLALVLIVSASCLVAQPGWAKTIFSKSNVYLSLMGEPFRTNEAGEAPFDQWFKLADQDSDGSISRLEFRTDAEAFFAALDTIADKVIDGDEMAEYEQMAPGRTRAAGGGAAPTSSSRPNPKSSAPVEKGQVAVVTTGDAPSASRIHPGDSRINFSEVPQPVAMADLNLDRRVTIEEFLKTASRRFSNYDVDQDGRLTRKELR